MIYHNMLVVHYYPKSVDKPTEEEHYSILGAKFFPTTDGLQVVAVAVAGFAHDWAGYIDTIGSSVMPSKQVQMVAGSGVKLSQNEAEGMFPNYTFWNRDYRK